MAGLNMPAVQRGNILHEVTVALRQNADRMAAIVHLETGKSKKDALGETGAAISQGLFMSGEGMRLYGRTTTSAMPGKEAMTIRCPVGIAGLIIAANTPIANVAWKVFPALVCGNTVILKAAEDTPATAWFFGKIAKEAGLPDGVLNIIQGSGPEAGGPIVESQDIDVVSFTGSSAVGRQIAMKVSDRMGRVSLELGGKNGFIVCDDADIDNAVNWAALSAFSNAGQRCASASRILVFSGVYDEFREKLLEKTEQLRLGNQDADDLGPVINSRQLENMLSSVRDAVDEGAVLTAGGRRLLGPQHAEGYYMEPTVLENITPTMDIWNQELFGPITTLMPCDGFDGAVDLLNNSIYGLTAAIHTNDINRAMAFIRQANVGVVTVNGGTFGF